MARSGSGNYVGGVILVAVGLGLLARRFVPFGWEQVLLLTLGLAFVVLGILRRAYGSLVSGMMLLGAGGGLVLGGQHALGLSTAHWLMLCLGLAFLALYLFGLVLNLRKHWWPLVPAVALLILGGGERVWHLRILPPSLLEALQLWWPVALVVLGVFLLVNAFRK